MKNGKGTAFPRLKRNVWLTLFGLPSALVLVIVIVSASVLGAYMDSDYRSSLRESVSLAAADFSTSLGVVDDDLRVLARDSAIVDFASTGDQSSAASASAQLTSAVNDNECLLGVTLYGSQEHFVQASFGVTGIPSREVLLGEDAIAAFYEGDKASMRQVRNTGIAKSFSLTSPYDPQMAILSCFVRISDGAGQTEGFLVADLNSQYLYDSYFDFTAYSRFQVKDTFLGSGDVFLRTATNGNASSSYGPFLITDSLQRLNWNDSYYRLDFEDLYVTVIIGNGKYYETMALLIASAIGLAAILIGVDYAVTRAMEKKIVGNLDGMVDKMKNPNI